MRCYKLSSKNQGGDAGPLVAVRGKLISARRISDRCDSSSRRRASSLRLFSRCSGLPESNRIGDFGRVGSPERYCTICKGEQVRRSSFQWINCIRKSMIETKGMDSYIYIYILARTAVLASIATCVSSSLEISALLAASILSLRTLARSTASLTDSWRRITSLRRRDSSVILASRSRTSST